MVHFRPYAAPSQWSVIQIAVAVLMAVPLPFAVQRSAAANDYEGCASALVGAGIEQPTAAAACGQALHPDQVSSCVVDVVKSTDVAAPEALSACSRDRRPKEVSNCVVDIHKTSTTVGASEVLQRCHLSVLPERYSACVVGLIDGAGLALADSLDSCSNAGYRPVDLAPTFIPAQ